MSTGNIIIAIICIVAFIFPFVLIGRKGRKAKKRLKRSLNNFVKAHNFELDKVELLDKSALGWDSKNHLALYTEIVNEQFVTRHIELEGIKTCKLNRKRRDINSSNGNESLLSKLELAFYPKLNSGEVETFILFDENSGDRLGDELQTGTKWTKIYNTRSK